MLQKMFLLPPLKGLNLYDNPFTMSPEYATELSNYMPPTTTLTVRPAVEFLLCMRGNVRGLYAYNVGRTMDYGTNWWNSNISYGASATLLVKTLDTDGKVFLWSVDPIAKSYKQVGTMSSPLYNDDSVLYKHTLFLASGDSNTAMKLFHQQKGSSDFALRIGDEGQTEIGNMQNITSYKNFIFMSGNDSLNIYFIEAQYADILDPINSSFWKTVENLFSPKFGQTFSLDGICQNGGSILRLFNLSRGGADTISTYLAAITNIGEIILFEGSDPSDTTGQKWAVAGRFQIAPPLNKFCICEMEGDTIVATKNGLISLRRIVFGQANDITENLEYKIFSLFYQYQFNIPAYTNFIGLYYHPRNRLLIFNIPDSLPMPFVNVESGLSCFAGDRIVFLKDFFTDTVVNQITSYLYSFNVRNGIVTKVYIEIDGDYAKNSFCIETTTDYVQGDATYNLFVDFYVMIEGVKQSLLQNILTFEVNDPNITLKTPIAWNENLKIYNDDKSDFQYAYIFPKDFTITNVSSDVKIYKEKMSDYTFATLAAADDLKPTPATSLTFFTNPYKSAEKKFYINVEDFFLSADNGCYLYNFQDPTTYPDGQKHFPPQIPSKDFPTQISLLRSFIYNLAQQDWRSDIYTATVNFIWYSYLILKRKDGSVKYIVKVTQNIELLSDKNLLYTGGCFNCTWLYEYATSPTGNFTTISRYVLENSHPRVPLVSQNHMIPTIHTEDDYAHFYLRGAAAAAGDYSYYYHAGKDYYVTLEGTNYITRYEFNPVTLDMSDIATFDFSDNVNGTGDNFCEMTATCYDDMNWDYINGVLGNMLSDFGGKDKKINPNTFYQLFQYLFSNIAFQDNPQPTYPPPPPTPKDSKSKKSDDENKSILNITDLHTQIFLNGLDLQTKFRSTQYVFDSHFGTWSSFKDVNMMRGVESANDFYFIVPNDVAFDKSTNDFHINYSSLCRLNQQQFGDSDIQSLANEYLPIKTSYKTVPTYDFQIAQKKIFKRLRIIGNPSAFWQPRQSPDEDYPFQLTPYSDYKPGLTTSFIHAFAGSNASKKVLKQHFNDADFNNLSYCDKIKFWKLYEQENEMLSQISIPILALPGIRFGLKIDMNIMEAYTSIYGFDVFFDVTNQIL